jgi:hypothetical protein
MMSATADPNRTSFKSVPKIATMVSSSMKCPTNVEAPDRRDRTLRRPGETVPRGFIRADATKGEAALQQS